MQTADLYQTYFSHILADAGYRNGYFGKWHVEQSNKLENFGWHEYNHRSGSMRGKPIDGSQDWHTPGVSLTLTSPRRRQPTRKSQLFG